MHGSHLGLEELSEVSLLAAIKLAELTDITLLRFLLLSEYVFGQRVHPPFFTVRLF
jgi:hypothetical protein